MVSAALKIQQLGAVLIGDDVDVGAGTTIDRGAIEDTIVEDGVKIDNQVQIGHNCHIGAHSVFADVLPLRQCEDWQILCPGWRKRHGRSSHAG